MGISKLTKSASKSINKGAKGISKGASKAAKATEKAANDTGKAIEKAADDTADVIIDTTNHVIDVAKNTYDYAEDFAKDTAKRTESIQATVLKNTEEMAKIGIDTTSKEFHDLSRQVEQVVIDGVEVCYDAALEAYAWLNENMCNIALSTALAMGVEAYFTPKPDPGDPGTETSIALSGMAATMLIEGGQAAAESTVMTGMAELITKSILLIPGVKGQVNEQILTNVIANCIDMTWASATAKALWCSNVGVGIVIGAWICPVVATMVCTRTIPAGYKQALEG